jgi:hypothetical protein
MSKSKRARTRKTGSASKVRSQAGGRKTGHHSVTRLTQGEIPCKVAGGFRSADQYQRGVL